MDIKFTQYFLPDGRQKEVFIDRPKDVAEKAERIAAAGYKLECEVLMTGHVSLTIFDPNQEIDVANEVCNNGPAVPESIDKMILGFEI